MRTAILGVSLAVQHHPARPDQLARLLDSLGPDAGRADVVVDHDPSGEPCPWRTYRAALELTPPEASHRLIVQDDAVALPGFLAAAELAVAAHPDVPVCFWVGGQPAGSALRLRNARKAGSPWAVMSPQDWVPLVACSWPVALAAAFVAWVDTRSFPRGVGKCSDDYLAGTFCRTHRIPVHATVPSLVEHPDDAPSLIGRPHRAGSNPGRVAAVWDPSLDPATVAW